MDYSAVKAVTFDAAQTLLHPQPSVGAVYREVMAEHGLDYSAAQLQSGFGRAFGTVAKNRSIADGELREWRYWEAIVRESIRELQPQPADFDALFHDLWHVFAEGNRWRVDPQAPRVLGALRERGYSVHLLTNWDKRVRRVVQETDLGDHFDHLFISSEIGADKPDPAIFTHVETTLGLSPRELLHVGDSFENDVDGALAAGWRALHLAPSPPAIGDHPTIPSLDGLLDRLPQSAPSGSRSAKSNP